MIKSDEFYARFDQGFAPARDSLPLVRLRGKASKYRVATAAGDLEFWFKVNSKASALPNQPGEFWPVITGAESLRDAQRHDDGIVSWYQYVTEEEGSGMRGMQHRVVEKAAAQEEFEHDLCREMLEARLPELRMQAEEPFEARLPHTALLYLDAEDATRWGELFARCLRGWLERFGREPETLARYMWRVHWSGM